MRGSRLAGHLWAAGVARRKPVRVVRATCALPRAGYARSAAKEEHRGSLDNPFPLPASARATPYEIFHLPPNSTAAEIKSRYYDLVKIYHPDRAMARALATSEADLATSSDHPGSLVSMSVSDRSSSSLAPEQAHENFKRIREAYTVLSNEARRKMYDRNGYGWDVNGANTSTSGPAGFDGPMWNGGFPRSASEWDAYEAWSASLRRGSPGSMHRRGWEFRGSPNAESGHDRFGWQGFAGNRADPGSDWFYGFGHAQQYANTERKPRYTSNLRFMMSLSSLTAVLAMFQYARLQQERRYVGGMEDRRHHDAVRSLQEARTFARSDVGRARMEEMRKRAREQQQSDDSIGGTAMVAGQDESEDVGWEGVIGRGGPSGRQAYEQRVQRLESGD